MVELLIVIAILAILMSLLLPSLNGALYSAKLSECQFKLKHMGMVFSIYSMDNEDKYFYVEGGQTRTSRSFQQMGSGMRDLTLPYLFGGRDYSSMNSETYAHSEMEKEFEDMFLCPLVDNEEIWPYITGWGGFHSRRVPRYAGTTYPLMFYHNFHAEGQGDPDLRQMRKVGDTWSLRFNSAQYSHGPVAARDYNYRVLASSVMMHYRTPPYGASSWGNNQIATDHLPLRAEGVFLGVHQNTNIAYRVTDGALYDYNANYLIDSGAVVTYDDVPFMPDSESHMIRFNDGSVYVPVEFGSPDP